MSSTLVVDNQVVLDLDDFYQTNSSLDILFDLQAAIPFFKVNLFAIPGRCSLKFLREVRKLEWLDLIPHGDVHETNRECEHWSYEESLNYLKRMELDDWTKGFKAPGWQISVGMYEALLDRNWWLADSEFNAYRRPKSLRTYLLHQPGIISIHGHIGHLNGHNKNALEFIYKRILDQQGSIFHFIDDLL